ncbi:MAG: hypothetical protein H0X37_19815 [Herpetosiphonaceae bacterium]|nr:hypothetical protein [Herpetosiphonaceae bacterium]
MPPKTWEHIGFVAPVMQIHCHTVSNVNVEIDFAHTAYEPAQRVFRSSHYRQLDRAHDAF